jgi:hypothetical protein
MLYLKEIGWFKGISILISLIFMQFSQNLYDLWLKSYVSKEPLFMIQHNFCKTLLLLSSINLISAFFRSFCFAEGNLVASKRVFEGLLRKVFFAKIKFFEKN